MQSALVLYLKVHAICTCPLPQSACNLHLSSTSKCMQSALVFHLKVHAICTCPPPESACNLHLSSTWKCMQSALVLYLKVHAICTCPLPQSACNLHLSSTSKCMQSALVLYLEVHTVNWPAGDDDNVAGDLGHVLDAHVHQAAQNGLHHKQKNQTSKGRQCETVWTLLVKGAILWYRTTTVALKAKWAAPQRKEPGMKNCTAPNGLKSPCKKPKNPLYHLAPVALCRLSSPSFTPLTVQVPLLE